MLYLAHIPQACSHAGRADVTDGVVACYSAGSEVVIRWYIHQADGLVMLLGARFGKASLNCSTWLCLLLFYQFAGTAVVTSTCLCTLKLHDEESVVVLRL